MSSSIHENPANSTDQADIVAATRQFLESMAGGAPAPTKTRGPGRPKGPGRGPGRPKGPGRGPGRPKGSSNKRGKRGVRANLSAEEIQAALDKNGGVKSRAAKTLGVTITTFNKYHDATLGKASSKRPAKKDGDATAAKKPGRPRKKRAAKK